MNQSERYNIGFAGKGIDPDWKMNRGLLTPAWTTIWGEIPIARVC